MLLKKKNWEDNRYFTVRPRLRSNFALHSFLRSKVTSVHAKMNYVLSTEAGQREPATGFPFIESNIDLCTDLANPTVSFVQQGSVQAHLAFSLTSREKLFSITSKRLLTWSDLSSRDNPVCCPQKSVPSEFMCKSEFMRMNFLMKFKLP